MKKLIVASFVIAMVAFLTGPAIAAKPDDVIELSNGYPSGPHYNLNIIAKKSDFQCPGVEIDPETGEPIYGNVIFVPQENEHPIEIRMESGKKGGNPKNHPLPTNELQVIDPCSGFEANDPAVLRLPPGEYYVYARARAKPVDDPETDKIEITPDLISVEDEFGNDLVLLGLVTTDGFQTPYASFTREKGKDKAVNITGLFEWTGTICYFSGTGDPEPIPKCCVDENDDGIYEKCTDAVWDGTQYVCPSHPDYALGEVVDVWCNDYTEDPQWVFSIGDFVEYVWDMDNSGVRLFKVRFYPKDAVEEAPSRHSTLATQWGKIRSE